MSVVLVGSQVAGLALLALALPFLHELWRRDDLVLGAVAGVAGALAVGLLYRALAIGTMGVISPITAVLAASIPIAYGVLARGEHPTTLATYGIGCALVAVVFVSLADGADRRNVRSHAGIPPGLIEALGAGALFGCFFVVLARIPADAGLAPLVGARAASIPLLLVACLATRQPVLPTRANAPIIALAGGLDMLANITFVLAMHAGGLLAIVSVLSALYPASTVILAAIVLHERLNRYQWVGVGFAFAGVALIAAGK